MLKLVMYNDEVLDQSAVNTHSIDTDQPNAQGTESAAPRSKKKRKSPPPEPTAAPEQVDGPVEDALVDSEAADEGAASESAATPVDRAMLEPLLFTTHHPLTA